MKKLYAISTVHLDTQWNWTIQEVIRDYIRDTLEKNFALLEKYPHYRVNFEGAFRYKLIREYYPALYERLKDYIAQGRWCVSGSAWEACDVNVPSAEAIMRQILYGNGYFQREFGKRSTDIFLPDCFGFRHSVPSIAAHMGLKSFSTQKLPWGVGAPIYRADGSVTVPLPDTRAPRMDLGRWQGPDGASLVATLLPGDYTYQFDNDGDTRPIHRREELLEQIEFNEAHTGAAVKGKYYGTGDIGGAPGDACVKLVEEACGAKDGLYQVVSASTDQLANELSPEQIAALPVYDGSLYIPHGFGALTSRTVCKRWNRKCELLADAAERAAVLARLTTGAPYPAERLRKAWETFLWHQFHDDLPGTSCVEAYTFTYNDYLIALNLFASELEAGIAAAASALDTRVTGIPLVVFNPVSAESTDLITARIPLGSPFVRVYTAAGEELPAQVSRENGQMLVKFAAGLAPVSCTVFDVRPSQIPCELPSALRVSENTLENHRYRLELDENGDIFSIRDKQNENRELLSAPIRLEIGEDSSRSFPSWELVPEDLKKPAVSVCGPADRRITDNGPAVVSLTVKRRFDKSEFTQVISLYAGSDRIDVDHEVQWYQSASMLRAVFPLTVENPRATFDLGLGSETAANSDYPYYQNTVHQWADLSEPDGSYGISVFNDCKYGMDKPDDRTLRLSLIHTPAGAYSAKSAQNRQDMGTNLFRFSLFGHAGAPDAVPGAAAGMNQPPIPFVTEPHPGSGSEISLVSCDREQLLVRAVKQEEQGERIILRVQETAGKEHSQVSLRFPVRILSAREVNGFEEDVGAVSFSDRRLFFDLGHFAPKTFAVELERAPEATKHGIPIELPWDRRITSANGEQGSGIVPAELYETQVRAGGIDFRLAPADGANAVACAGQRLPLPAGTKQIHLLTASVNGDKKSRFLLDGKAVSCWIQDMRENIGTWDVPIDNQRKHIKPGTVGTFYTHTHENGEDRPYSFAYLFRVSIPTEGASTLTLPEDEDILAVAATADMNAFQTLPGAALYDQTREETELLRRFTVIDGDSVKTSLHPENSLVYLRQHLVFDPVLGLFRGYAGAQTVRLEDGVSCVRMEDQDITIRAVYDPIGITVPFDSAACRANDTANAHEMPVNAITYEPYGSKWGGKAGSGPCWLEVGLKYPARLSHWYVEHAGCFEDDRFNSRDFSLEYRLGDSAWAVADQVVGNTEKRTCRSFPAVLADAVRLTFTAPTQDGEQYARIYHFQVYTDPEDAGGRKNRPRQAVAAGKDGDR